MKAYIISIVLTLPLLLSATSLERSYKITFGLFGTLGEATTSLTKSNNNYYIRMEAKTVGVAKALSQNRVEIYESKGKIENGILLPNVYTKTRKNDRYNKIKKYTFDHINSKVYLEKNEHYYEDTKVYLEKNEHYPMNKERIVKSKEEYKFYAQNDILTLFFNIMELIQNSDKNKMILHAVGGKKENGRIDFERLEGKKKSKMASFFQVDESETILKVVVNQKIFTSKNGEMFISIDKENLCSNVVLKNVIFFGDIKGTQIVSKN